MAKRDFIHLNPKVNKSEICFIIGNGAYVLIDSEDYETISRYRWRTVTGGYAIGEIAMHRLLCKTDLYCVDHINNDPTDNRKANLRPATRAQNKANSKVDYYKKYKGVHKRPHNGKYFAKITHGGKTILSKPTLLEEDAAREYDAMAYGVHGEFAWLNFKCKECKDRLAKNE